MPRIETLTPEQEAKLIEYRDKWMAIGLSTEPADHSKAEDALRRVYEIAGHAAPKQIIWAGSPLSGSIIASILKKKSDPMLVGESVKASVWDSVWPSARASFRASVGDSVWASVWDSVGASVKASVGDNIWNSVRASVWDSVKASVGDNIWNSVKASVWDSVKASVGDNIWNSVKASVWASVWASVRASVRASVGDSVWDSVWDSVGASVRASVGDSIWNSVRASVWDSVKASVGDNSWNSVWPSVRNLYWQEAVQGQQDAACLGFYDYFLEVLKLESCTDLIPLLDLSRHANWFYPYKNICIISEKPTVCNLKNGKIHCDGGPSIRYPDGFSVWALNGVRVSQEIAETSAVELKSDLILSEKNAQVRAEIVKKIGIDRVIKDLGAECIDKRGDYELLLLDLKDGRKREFLRMKNPSVDLWHIEGCKPGIKTVTEALAWRNGLETFYEPEQLT